MKTEYHTVLLAVASRGTYYVKNRGLLSNVSTFVGATKWLGCHQLEGFELEY